MKKLLALVMLLGLLGSKAEAAVLSPMCAAPVAKASFGTASAANFVVTPLEFMAIQGLIVTAPIWINYDAFRPNFPSVEFSYPKHK